MSLFKLWFLGITNPRTAFAELRKKPAPLWGLWAVLIRFVTTSFTSILLLYLLNRKPFVTPCLSFLSEENYYAAEIFFLPVFGVLGWLLAGSVVHIILRLSKKTNDFDWILNVIGWGLLIVMPAVWLLDWITIGLNIYGQGLTPVIHAFISVWEIVLMAIGLTEIKGLNFWPAFALGFIVKAGIYIPMAAIFVR